MPYSYDPDASGILGEGVHVLTVTSIEDRTSRNGDPMWLIRFEDAQDREVVEWVVQTRIIDWKFKPLWEAAGLQWPTAAAILDEQQLIDKQVQVTIEHEKSDQFGTTPRIAGYAPVGESTSDLPGQESFDTGDPVGATRYGQAPTDDDEIPF